MNKAIFFIVVPCIIALVLVNVQGNFYGGGYGGYGLGGYGGQNNNNYYNTLLQQRSLNHLSRTASIARLINYIPLILLINILTNNTQIPVIG